MKQFHVYILASSKNGTLYIGVTSNLTKRLDQHRSGKVEGFTKQHHVHRLVYYEACERAEQAITREKQLKTWNRAWKIALIKEFNPTWKDLVNNL
jgi:putative endonuclease